MTSEVLRGTSDEERVRYGATRGAQRVFLEALDRALLERVRFCVGNEWVVVGDSSGSAECRFSVGVEQPRFFTDVLCLGNLGLGEAFMRGDFVMEEGRLDDFLTLLLRSRVDAEIRRTRRLALRAGWIRLRNSLRSRQDVVQSHYDLGNDLYESFLDPTLTYTCGYANSPDDSLEQLQQNKLARICEKLRLEPGERIVDLGCGFGGLLMYAAEHYGTRGIGVTLSKNQQEWASAEIRRRDLADRVEIRLMDYRAVEGTFDKVVSIGLLEHVPPREYGVFCRKVSALLKPSSVGLVHAIGTAKPNSRHDPFIQKYVFPSSHQIQLPKVVAALEKEGLAVLDVENMVRHYVLTALAWLDRFNSNRATLDPARYDETFCRMWEYWLSCGVAAARASDGALYQVLFHNDRSAPIPLRRV